MNSTTSAVAVSTGPRRMHVASQPTWVSKPLHQPDGKVKARPTKEYRSCAAPSVAKHGGACASHTRTMEADRRKRGTFSFFPAIRAVDSHIHAALTRHHDHCSTIIAVQTVQCQTLSHTPLPSGSVSTPSGSRRNEPAVNLREPQNDLCGMP